MDDSTGWTQKEDKERRINMTQSALVTLLLLTASYSANAQRIYDFMEDSITGQRIYVTGDRSVKIVSKEYNLYENHSNHVRMNCKYPKKGQPLNGCFRGKKAMASSWAGISYRTYGVKWAGELIPEDSNIDVTAYFKDGVMNGKHIESYTSNNDFVSGSRIVVEANQKNGELHGEFSVIRGVPSPSYKEDSVYIYNDIETSKSIQPLGYRIFYFAKRDTLYKSTFNNGTGYYCSFLTNGEIFRKGKLVNSCLYGVWVMSKFRYSSGVSTGYVDSEFYVDYGIYGNNVYDNVYYTASTTLGVKVAIQRKVQEFKEEHNIQDSTIANKTNKQYDTLTNNNAQNTPKNSINLDIELLDSLCLNMIIEKDISTCRKNLRKLRRYTENKYEYAKEITWRDTALCNAYLTTGKRLYKFYNMKNGLLDGSYLVLSFDTLSLEIKTLYKSDFSLGTGMYAEYYPNSQLMLLGSLTSGRRDGYWIIQNLAPESYKSKSKADMKKYYASSEACVFCRYDDEIVSDVDIFYRSSYKNKQVKAAYEWEKEHLSDKNKGDNPYLSKSYSFDDFMKQYR